MRRKMNSSNDGTEISLYDQIKKFAIKSMLGFQTVLLFGLGRRLGIFDYLNEKGKSAPNPDEISTVTFTLDELVQELKLDSNYLDGWLHMALECGIFERDQSCDRCLKTAPYVYYLLVDRDNMFYFGDFLGGFSHQGTFQEELLLNFKTGKKMEWKDIPEEVYIDGQRMSATMGKRIQNQFSQSFADHAKVLHEGGSLLEVGSGYGFNLKNWADEYENTRIVGIDIDPQAIEYSKKLAEQNNWKDRVENIHVTINDYANDHKERFDVIVLNQVLHEMEPDENYRVEVFNDLYSMLKNEGLLIVGEHMIPEIFAPKQARYVEIMHKWFEVGMSSRFYDEKSFREFINSTRFKEVEFIQEGQTYFWAIRRTPFTY
jgi:2-polyprenyl-3-methyl-5-hydroxy-6-metoxy-1,4-benzoquinol methylase